MSEGVAATLQRNAFRFALTGILGIWLSGCADATRFADSGNPFANPFNASGQQEAAPTPRISSTPLSSAAPYNHNYASDARPSPSGVAMTATPSPEATGSIRPQPVAGSAAGWTAVGGSPIVVGANDDAAALSARYEVPEAALLSANGLHSRSEIHANMRLVIPVYNAHGDTRVAKADDNGEKPRHDADADRDGKPKAHHAKRDDDDDADDAKSKRADAEHRKHKDQADASDADAKPKKTAKADKTEEGKLAKSDDAPKSGKHGKDAAKAEKSAKESTEVAKSEPVKAKKPETDKTPTGDVASGASGDADESGKFRWPARGRIIQGFKTGGNDGINIALPEGTSVRAAEDGKVAYAGSALKGYGNLVLIRHTNGFVTAYANNGELNVKSGDSVKRGQVIAKSGQTGDVSSPQLHFELRKGQTPVDPTSYLAGL